MIHAFEEYLKISNEYDIKAKKIDAYLENAKRELLINLKQSELKVIEESGTDDDLTLLKEAAEEGFVAKIKSAIKAIIDAFIKFMTDLKDRVVRVIVTQKSRNTLRQIEKKVKLTPFLSKRKVKIDKVEDQIKVIREFEAKCDKETAKALSKLKSADDIQIGALRDTFDNKFRKVCMASAAATTVTLGMLVSIINKQIESLPSAITDIERENSGALKKLMDSAIDDEAAATCKAAMTAAANFRTKLAKTEANIYVDSLGDNIAVAKKALKIDKTVTAKNTLTGESVEDEDYDDYTMESEYGDEDFDRLVVKPIQQQAAKRMAVSLAMDAAILVGVGVLISSKHKSKIRKLFSLYEKMNSDCIPFKNLTKASCNNPYELSKYNIHSNYEDNTKFTVFKDDYDKVVMYIQENRAMPKNERYTFVICT